MTAGSTYGGAITATSAYDPATGIWTRMADMNLPRWYPAVLKLQDGRILAISGEKFAGTWSDTPEVYDPGTNTWTLLNAVNTSDVHEDLYPNAYLLPDGRVLVIANSTGHTWLLDVNSQTWVAGPPAPFNNGSSVMYRPGKILLSGGTGQGPYGVATGSDAAVLDMTVANPSWKTIANMNFARGYHQLSALPDGRVISVGGSTLFSTSSLGGVLPTEIWDPSTGAWTVMNAMQDARMNHSIGVLMPDATFLSAGGGHEMRTGAYDYFTAETYQPPYLFAGPRPTITSAPATAGYAKTITVKTPDAATIGSVALMELSTETHHYDSGGGYQSLAFTAGSGQLNVTMPASSSMASPGYYMVFIVSQSGVPSVATMVQLTGPDANPLTAKNGTPASGSTNVPALTVPTVTFSQPVQPASIRFTLRDGLNAVVPTTTSYNASLNRASFTPAKPLGYATSFTATVTGATDLAGHTLTAPYTWSFSTAPTPTNCPCTIWSASAAPSVASAGDSGSLELGVRVEPDMDGYITGIQFYKGPTNGGTHTAHLWATDGTLLASGTFTGESATGWQSVTFGTPVAVSAGGVYIASYFAPAGGYAYDSGYFASGGVDNAPLHALQSGNGVFKYSAVSAFPTTSSSASANYWVDVTFRPTLPPSTTPPVVTSTNPAAGAGNANVTGAIIAIFSEAVRPSSITFTLQKTAGGAVAGSVGYLVPTNMATFTPSSQLAFGTGYTATISGATDLSGNVMTAPFTWSFTTPTCPCTTWSVSATPTNTSVSDNHGVELGLKFRPDANGYITGVRFYKGAGNGGAHVGNLWTVGGVRLATVTFTNESASGWQTAAFSSPVAVTAGTDYVISYYAPQGHYAFDSQYFASAGVDNPPLHALKAGADGPNAVYVYAAASAFPTSASSVSPNYWVDAVFEAAVGGPAPAVTAQSPAPGATGVSQTTRVTATFSKAVQPGTITFTLTAGSAVAGSLYYDTIGHALTFTPSSPLVFGTTYTATVSGATDLSGTPMAAPVSWSFTTAGVACPCTLWPAITTPSIASVNDGNSVELGVRFTADISGHITGVRFYKGAGNTGTHIANLWTASGQLLATATFTGESASGWQQVNFATPVAITAGTVYVVSYFAPAGHYAYDAQYFGTAYDNPPLHALAGGNGVYAYGASSRFPNTASVANGNYWVDVVLTN
jgi:hypothetical protein